MSGYICLHRKIMGNPIWTQMPESRLKVWLTILLRANWQPSKAWDFVHKAEIEVPAGTMLTSLPDLVKQSGCSLKQVRLSLEYLESSRMVSVKRGTRHTLITVLNWETYQQQGQDEGTIRAGEGHAEGTPRALSEEVNKGRREDTRDPGAAFDRRWTEKLYAVHPKKRGKDRALASVSKIRQRCVNCGTDPERKFQQIEACLIAWAATKDWRKDNARFAPQLADWLDNDGFEQMPGSEAADEDQPVFRLMM